MFKNERIWRILANFWTIFLGIFLIVDFFSFNKLDYLTATFSVIYTAVLSLYVGTKEFERWCDVYKERRHPGEVFIIMWTILIAFLLSAKVILGSQYSVSPEAVADYLIVLSLFALTRRSKRICAARKSGNKNKR
ncbi:MAG TPA: hypothetical protein VMV71_03150 [Candidatus Paceibacterota bacterium]|nr:hypothetical protein [Candidatus Paceibacterota bacterium]